MSDFVDRVTVHVRGGDGGNGGNTDGGNNTPEGN
jgi:hypothetical protein